MTTNADRITTIISEMTPTVRSVTGYEFDASGIDDNHGDLTGCIIRHVCRVATVGHDDLTVEDIDEANGEMNRLAARAEAARAMITYLARSGALDEAKVNRDDVDSLESVMDLRHLAFSMGNESINQEKTVERAVKFLQREVRR